VDFKFSVRTHLTGTYSLKKVLEFNIRAMIIDYIIGYNLRPVYMEVG
jgi:hypothetical protein